MTADETPHPDRCEHGRSLKYDCRDCARCPCCGEEGRCPCIIYDFEGYSNETGPWSEKRCTEHRRRV